LNVLEGNHRVKSELFDEFAKIGKALASGRRIEIIDILANGERTVEALAEQLGISLANTSQHLQILREAGLVSSRKRGTFVVYRLASRSVYSFWAGLRSLATERLAAVEKLVEAYVGSRDGLEALGREELLSRLHSAHPPIVLDVRPNEEFRAGHVPGAVSIPPAELERRLKELPADRQVVAYCRGPYCAFAPEAVRLLRQRGVDAHRLEDGLPEWAAAGFPVEGVKESR
jgi:rhodanese-related sulfurtransferase/DNA-binding transcriptional ArsR family regulator